MVRHLGGFHLIVLDSRPGAYQLPSFQFPCREHFNFPPVTDTYVQQLLHHAPPNVTIRQYLGIDEMYSQNTRCTKCQKQRKISKPTMILFVLPTREDIRVTRSKIFLIRSLISNRPERCFKSLRVFKGGNVLAHMMNKHRCVKVEFTQNFCI